MIPGVKMNYIDIEQLCAANNIAFKRDVPLKEHCTFKIGGTVPLVVWPGGAEQIALLLAVVQCSGIPLMVLGKGSNVLFADSGFKGMILCLSGRFSRITKLDDTTLACESGAALSALCVYAQEQGLSGLEFAYGIPGSVGGAVYMNAGAYGGEMKDVLLRTHHLDLGGRPGVYSGGEMQLSYRHSAYSDADLVITGAVVRLRRGDPLRIRADMDDYMQRRRYKQPLEFPSAGSTFRRPPGAYASALIDECGLKGRGVGGAQVSEKHAGFVINRGGATCEDVLKLIDLVRGKVLQDTGYKLECEVKIIR